MQQNVSYATTEHYCSLVIQPAYILFVAHDAIFWLQKKRNENERNTKLVCCTSAQIDVLYKTGYWVATLSGSPFYNVIDRTE